MSFDLSDEAKAVLVHDGPVLVLGGPGSGKTTLSLLKAQQLIPTLKPGQEILFLSFSRAAVRQVLLRCADVLTSAERKLISVKTYHAFCMDLLRAHGRLLNGRPARILFPAEARLRKTALGSGVWDAEEVRLAAEDGVYAFDQFAPSAAQLVGGSLALAELISDRYPIIILDEFQDTSDAQWELVQQLGERSSLLVLADQDQCIYDYDPRVSPERLNQLRAALAPAEFDLGGENHRSPSAGILAFGDAVLRNSDLPQTHDVSSASYWPRNFDATVHAAVMWTFSQLSSMGVDRPSVAVLGRTNRLVGQISVALSQEHVYSGTRYAPVAHDLLWDPEQTAAAAQVVASILEWPERPAAEAVAVTCELIGDFFDAKNALKASKTAVNARDRFRGFATQLRGSGGLTRRSSVAGRLLTSRVDGLQIVGDAARDWTTARALLEREAELRDVFESSKHVQLFHATDEIGRRLAEEWTRSGSYRDAARVIKRVTEANMLNDDRREPRGCVLMTLHKSKGKEFDAVILVERLHGNEFFDQREPSPYPKSRRLLRVGITRAKRRVVLLRPIGAQPLVGGSA